MKPVDISALPVNAEGRKALLQTEGVDGCVVHIQRGRSRVVAFGPACHLPSLEAAAAAHPDAHASWVRGKAAPRAGRTALALQMLDADAVLTPYAAAKAAGVRPEAVYRALQRRTGRDTCPCCRQLLPTPAGAAT